MNKTNKLIDLFLACAFFIGALFFIGYIASIVMSDENPDSYNQPLEPWEAP